MAIEIGRDKFISVIVTMRSIKANLVLSFQRRE